MIVSFKDQATQDIFEGSATKATRKICPQVLWKLAAQKLDQLDSAANLDDLRSPPGNKLEKLGGNRRGQFSIRINIQYRICFQWREEGPEQVHIVDYHK